MCRSLCSTLFPYTTLFRSGVLRDRYFDLVGEDPGFFLENIGGKLVVTAGQMRLWLLLIAGIAPFAVSLGAKARMMRRLDRKSIRLNSSHLGISYAVFCLKK